MAQHAFDGCIRVGATLIKGVQFVLEFNSRGKRTEYLTHKIAVNMNAQNPRLTNDTHPVTATKVVEKGGGGEYGKHLKMLFKANNGIS